MLPSALVRRALANAAVLAALVAGHAPLARASLVWPDVPERIERALSSPDAATRRGAARDLSTLGQARATPLVLKALGDGDLDVRLAAAQSAVRLRVTSATDAVLPWLGEREPRLKIAACEVALAMPNARAVPAVARALGDGDAQVRAACADALGGSGSPDAVAPLAGKLDDPTPAVRVQVARALAKLGDGRAVVPLVGKVQDSVPEVRQAVVRALGDLADGRATQALLLALRDVSPEVRIEALGSLGRLRAPEAATAIEPLATDRNPGVRQAALVALGRIGTPAAVRALVRSIGASSDDAATTLERTPVRDALASAGQTAVTELTAALERPISPAVAASAAWVLGELKATASAGAIVSALRRGVLPPAPALHALAGAGNESTVPVVLEFVSDPSPVVRAEALRTASVLLDPTRPDGRAVEPLAAALRDARTSAGERAQIASLLGRTGAPRAAAELVGLVKVKDASLRLAAIDALGALGQATPQAKDGVADDALVPLLGDRDPAVRLRAAVALASSGGLRARSALVAKLAGGEELDRYAVLTALGGVLERHPDAGVASRLLEQLAFAAGPERDAVIEAASRAKLPVVTSALAKLAESGDADDRRAAVTALGGHPASDAVRKAATSDADASVRAQAAYALGEIGDASALGALTALARGGDTDVATNAAAGIARLAMVPGRVQAPSLVAAACPMLADGRATGLANALAALAAARARGADGKPERALLASDTSDLVRANAARVLASGTAPEDRAALDRCASTDRSSEVARVCRPRPAGPPSPLRTRAVTAYVFGETATAPRPRAPYLVEMEGGVLRAGIADRRGALFDPAAPASELALRRPPR